MEVDLQRKYNSEGGPAFPHQSPVESWGDPSRGMSLRDYFAAQALHFVALGRSKDTIDAACQLAYAYADAMLKARLEAPPEPKDGDQAAYSCMATPQTLKPLCGHPKAILAHFQWSSCLPTNPITKAEVLTAVQTERHPFTNRLCKTLHVTPSVLNNRMKLLIAEGLIERGIWVSKHGYHWRVINALVEKNVGPGTRTKD